MNKPIELFEKELLRAIEGTDLQTYNLKSDPFLLEKKNAPFLNRTDEQKILSRQITRLSKGDINLISVNGDRGIGKTSFIFSLIPSIDRFKSELNFSKIYIVEGLVDFEDKFIKSDAILREVRSKPQQKILFIIDDLDIIYNRHKDKIISYLEELKACIGIWTTDVLNDVKNSKNIKLPSSEEILLKVLSKDICKAIVLSRIGESKIDKRNENVFFDDVIIDELVVLSNGNPQNLLSLCQQFFTFMIIKKAKQGNKSLFTKFREQNKLPSSEEIIKVYNSLTERQKEAFEIVSKSIEITYEELKNKMGLARSSAVEYLITLKDMGLLDVKTKGKVRVYYVTPEIAYTLERIIKT